MPPGGRRSGRMPSSRPAGSSSGGNARRASGQQRTAEKNAKLPTSIHDVFDFVTNQEQRQAGVSGSRGQGRRNERGDRSERRMRRTLAEDEAGPSRLGRRGERDDGESDAEGAEREADIHNYGTAPIFGDDDIDSDGNVQGGVRSEDDEDIDSDEAFGASDEERYEDVAFQQDRLPARGSKGAKRHTRPMHERSDDSSDDDDDDGSVQGSDASIDDAEMVDLSRMLDDDDYGAEEVQRGPQGSDSTFSDDDADESDDDRLQKRMEAFSAMPAGAKRGAGEADMDADRPRRKRVLKDRTEAVPEGEWSAPASGGALTFEDLMRPIAEQGGTSLASLRNSTKALQSRASDSTRQPVASKKGGGALSAPLPAIIQDRLDRSAAYEETKGEVQGWQPTIKHLREAEHLSFPLQPEPVNRPSTASISANFRPANEFEANIAKMLEREGASEKRMAMAEELKMNERGMSAEEIKKRTAELRRMRELLFREEQKAKRVSKIKSKTYRRIARKQKQREMEKMREAGVSLPEGGSEDEEEKLKAERARAQERATLKHKNAGKWAKDTLGAKGLQDMPEARQAIDEQLRRGEELRRRIHAKDSDDSSESESDDGDDDSEDPRSAHDRAFNELQTLENKDGSSAHEDVSDKKGLWGMKFMEDARRRRAKETQEEVDDFVRGMGADSGLEEGADPEGPLPKAMQVSSNTGRLVFNQSQGGDKEEASEARVITSGESEKRPITATTIKVQDTRGRNDLPLSAASQTTLKNAPDEGSNPWLAQANGSAKVSRKKNDVLVSKRADAESKAANRVKRHATKVDAADGLLDDGELMIDPNQQINVREADQPTKKNGAPARRNVTASAGETSHSESEESVDDEPIEVGKRRNMAISQRDLVAEAFAGDDVLADFAAEKEALIDAERPQEIDTSLPGWGSWGGRGVKTSKKHADARKARFTKSIPGLDPSKRKDAGMSNVIINQKHDKKAAKYKSQDVPYPYTSRAQYEMAMRNPLGPEWNTRTQHQRLTLPRVVTKPGKAIQPIERLF